MTRKSKGKIYESLLLHYYYVDMTKLKYLTMKYSNGKNESAISKNLSRSQDIA